MRKVYRSPYFQQSLLPKILPVLKQLLFLTLSLILQAYHLRAQPVQTVCASGCNFTTIQAAVNAAVGGEIIQIVDAVHTEANIFVNKSVNFCGAVPGNIVQAAATPSPGNGRIFSIQSAIKVSFNDLTLRHGGVSSNITGGAIFNEGVLSISYCTLSDNQANRGGAVASSGSGRVTVLNSTFENNTVVDATLNTAQGAALFLAAGANTITNSTFSGNQNNTTGTGDGGAISLLGGASLTMIYNTVAFNTIGATGTGAGISAPTGSSLSLTNNIISNNTGANDLYLDGTLLTNQTNIVPTCGSATAACGTFLTGDPDLEPLGDIGGCTDTHDLGAMSAAIGAGTPNAITMDQRGQSRNATQPHIGAVELSATVPPCVGSVTCMVAIMPVELSSFKLTPEAHSVMLTWTTARELGNHGFEIERAVDVGTWETIGFVAGAGSSDAFSDYRFYDSAPLPGLNHYRLRQIDLDGQFEYSEILSARIHAAPETFSVAPNPVRETLVLRWSEARSGQIRIFDARGMLVLQRVAPPSGRLELSVATIGLVPGAYQVQFLSDGGRQLERASLLIVR